MSDQKLGSCGGYALLVELAAGGMATVYLGRGNETSKNGGLVAIKRPHRHLASDKVYLSMLVDEARLASLIEHEGVVKVRELGFESGEPFIVMDYIEGASLAEVRKELASLGRALDPKFAVRMTLDALLGLQAAHVLHDEKGQHLEIIHRDVSPHNVLVGYDGRSRLTDFGIAKAADRVQVTRTHEVKGKLAYLAPERIDKRRMCTVQSDVFSMAVVIWECIAGRRLFRGDQAIDTLQEVMTAPIPSLKKIGAPISQPLDDVILRGLSRDLDVRYKTAAEFASALEKAAGKNNVATHAEVGMLVEALCGEKLRVRHDQLRSVLEGEDVTKVLEDSGLPSRPAPTPEMRERERVAVENVAPPAPSARYAFGQGSEQLQPSRFTTSRSKWVIGGIALLAAAAILAFVVGRKDDKPAVAASKPSASVRSVVVAVPFQVTRVTFDDQQKDFEKAVDTVTFEVPASAGQRHHIVAIGGNGERAEGFARESEGIAKPEGTGYAMEILDSYDDDQIVEVPSTNGGPPRKVRRPRPAAKPSASAPAPPAPKPIGTVKDGFTRLK